MLGDAFGALFLIATVIFLAPLIARAIPGGFVPETVLLLAGGMAMGAAGFTLTEAGEPISFLRELGVGFLFLLAGYELDLGELRGSGGRHAIVGWFASLSLAFAAVIAMGVGSITDMRDGAIALAIAMTSTALGTLLPILRERGLLSTSVGAAVLNHGAIGEVGPIVLMALLLGSRATWASALVLAGFMAITALIIVFNERVKRAGTRLVAVIQRGQHTTAQTTIRAAVLLLVGLCALAEVFELDVVLGAFAAGVILRRVLPEGSRPFEEKLDGLAYGFFIPIFFVTSGMTITVSNLSEKIGPILGFLVLLVAVRGVPVLLVSAAERKRDGSRVFNWRQSLQVACYSTTALPIIVAVSQVAVSAGTMTRDVASTLILAGALSVLIMPTAALPLSRRTDKLPQTQTMGVVQGPVRADGSTTASTQEEDGYAVGRPSDGAEAQDAPEVRTALYVPPHERVDAGRDALAQAQGETGVESGGRLGGVQVRLGVLSHRLQWQGDEPVHWQLRRRMVKRINRRRHK